jgi:hypothetical protein
MKQLIPTVKALSTDVPQKTKKHPQALIFFNTGGAARE